MALNNFMFFDINYGEYASITGTNLSTATSMYAYDNRSDTGLVDFTDVTGEFIYDFGSNTSIIADTLLLANHNFSAFSFAVALTATGTWTTLTAYTGQTVNTAYYNIGSLTTIYDAKVTFTSTQTGTGYFGEFIVTKKKFTIDTNPNIYSPKLSPMMSGNQMYTGKQVFSKRADNVFSAEIGWDILQGSNVGLTNTDLNNVTELIRRNTSFIFWPNGNNFTQYVYTMRPQDIYKCKCVDSVGYEYFSDSIDYMIKAIGYKFVEVV